MSVVVQPLPHGAGSIPTLESILHGEIQHDVEEDPMVVWDKGVFLNELQKQGLVLRNIPAGAIDGSLATNAGLSKGTYKGTQLALTEMYRMIEEAYISPSVLNILTLANRDVAMHLSLIQKASSRSFPSKGPSNRSETYINGPQVAILPI